MPPQVGLGGGLEACWERAGGQFGVGTAGISAWLPDPPTPWPWPGWLVLLAQNAIRHNLSLHKSSYAWRARRGLCGPWMSLSSARRGARGPAGVPTPHLAPDLRAKKRREDRGGDRSGWGQG